MIQLFPRDTVLNSISVRVSVTSPSFLFFPLTLRAQLYVASPSSNLFFPRPGAACQVLGFVAFFIGDVTSCESTGLSIPIVAGETGVIVISVDTLPSPSNVFSAQFAVGLTTSDPAVP